MVARGVILSLTPCERFWDWDARLHGGAYMAAVLVSLKWRVQGLIEFKDTYRP